MSILAFNIARRYFLSSKGQSFINIIAIFSMLAIAVATFLLFFVLSVFNGLSSLIMGVHSSFDPEIQISHAREKVFDVNPDFLNRIKNIEGVDIVTEIIEEDAFANYESSQKVVRLKGVSANIKERSSILDAVVDGTTKLEDDNSYYAILGRGIQYGLNVSMSDQFHSIQLWYPKRKKKLVKEDNSSFNQIYVRPSGVFEIERQYDEKYVIVAIGLAEQLFDFKGQRTALEITVKEGVPFDVVAEKLKEELGLDYKVKTREELHEVLFKAIKIEKLATYMIFVFILLVASLNIFLTLSMLVISKKRDIANMYSIGASTSFVRQIFLWEGGLIGLVGSGTGFLLAVLFCYLQQEIGIIGMSVDSALVDAMPVKMELFDALFTVFTTVGITVLISIYPAIKASRVQIKNEI